MSSHLSKTTRKTKTKSSKSKYMKNLPSIKPIRCSCSPWKGSKRYDVYKAKTLTHTVSNIPPFSNLIGAATCTTKSLTSSLRSLSTVNNRKTIWLARPKLPRDRTAPLTISSTISGTVSGLLKTQRTVSNVHSNSSPQADASHRIKIKTIMQTR